MWLLSDCLFPGVCYRNYFIFEPPAISLFGHMVSVPPKPLPTRWPSTDTALRPWTQTMRQIPFLSKLLSLYYSVISIKQNLTQNLGRAVLTGLNCKLVTSFLNQRISDPMWKFISPCGFCNHHQFGKLWGPRVHTNPFPLDTGQDTRVLATGPAHLLWP